MFPCQQPQLWKYQILYRRPRAPIQYLEICPSVASSTTASHPSPRRCSDKPTVVTRGRRTNKLCRTCVIQASPVWLLSMFTLHCKLHCGNLAIAGVQKSTPAWRRHAVGDGDSAAIADTLWSAAAALAAQHSSRSSFFAPDLFCFIVL